MKPTPPEILEKAYGEANKRKEKSFIKDKNVAQRIEYVCRCLGNRAGVRLLMSCMLAKIDNPKTDPRKPYTEIGTEDSFSGRTYDEQFITHFINKHSLPCNSTTAFLTPALRNIDSPLTTKVDILGRPPQVYSDSLKLLDEVAKNRVSAEDILQEVIRVLILVRDENKKRMETLLAGLETAKEGLPLSSEDIINLLEQHLLCKHSSRLPVLIVAAAYEAIEATLGEKVSALNAHTAADIATGALGDVEVCLVSDDKLVTVYEMKERRVTIDDIDHALEKIAKHKPKIDNYIFVTTDVITEDVVDYATSFYKLTNGTEIAILDCIGFTRHFLHLFHRSRIRFLDAYQRLLLTEPDSAVSQPLKDAFLSLRTAAESDV
jgi:hypothetical protein